MHACPKYRQRTPRPQYGSYFRGGSVVRNDRATSCFPLSPQSSVIAASGSIGLDFERASMSIRSSLKHHGTSSESGEGSLGVLNTKGRSSSAVREKLRLWALRS